MEQAFMADAILVCPGCNKTWPADTTFCTNCATSLHHAKVYVAQSDTPVAPATTATPIRQTRDDGLDRIRANNYYALRARATTLEFIGYVQLFLGVAAGIGTLIALVSAILSGAVTTDNANPATTGFAQVIGYVGYIIATILGIITYRMLMSSYATFIQRDELLMRIDVAMNTAVIVSQITRMRQNQ